MEPFWSLSETEPNNSIAFWPDGIIITAAIMDIVSLGSSIAVSLGNENGKNNLSSLGLAIFLQNTKIDILEKHSKSYFLHRRSTQPALSSLWLTSSR
jgi:hypothetical protein